MHRPALPRSLKAPFAPWRFEPTRVDGKAVAARRRCGCVCGKSTGKGDYEVSMTSVDFSEYDPKATDSVTAERMAPPRYPEEAFRNGGQGDVILMVKVARDGTVADVIAEQVNMTVVGAGADHGQDARQLAKASINTARKWTFIRQREDARGILDGTRAGQLRSG
jgi:hypothetical protein